jgi:hypothetical protein
MSWFGDATTRKKSQYYKRKKNDLLRRIGKRMAVIINQKKGLHFWELFEFC